MEPARVRITFEPSGATTWVVPGTTLHEAALSAGVPLSVPCGGRGVCGACGVRVVEGILEEPDDIETTRSVRLRPGVRLACRARVVSSAVVRPLIALRSSLTGERALPIHARTVVGVDLGTTGISAVAVDVETGIQGPVGSAPNLQSSVGADVLSRIAAAMAGQSQALKRTARESIEQAIGSALAGVESRPERVVVAGNTAMEALLCGADVAPLAAHPFEAPRPSGPCEIETPGGVVDAQLMPVVASFVGGDTVAGLVHTGLMDEEGPSLLVDLGTNAEIALNSAGRLWVASAAAGPAFEGVGIEFGGPAAEGSLLAAHADDGEWRLETLGDTVPRRFAGSGLLSAIAALRRLGHLQPDGLLVSHGPLARHMLVGDDGVLRVRVGESGVTLSQLDVRTFQLAKAAVRVGVEFTLSAAGVDARALRHLYVAGAFGSGLAADDLVELGLVPASAREAILPIGNAALFGALAVAVTPTLLDGVFDSVASAHHVDLAADPRFQSALMDALKLAPFDA